ncbi:envelope stress response membrane protein PspB [Aurantivibrio infirmus]
MSSAGIVALVTVVMIFSIPIVAIWASVVKTRYKALQSNVTNVERDQLQRLTNIADSLAERIETLEAILDSEVPDWRDDHDKQ